MDISEQLYEILYEKEPSEAIGMIGDCTDSIFLHQLIANYNWDNGTALPEAVAENSCCDMGTALMIFELYGGYDHLLDSGDSAFTDHEKCFLSGLIEKISNDLSPRLDCSITTGTKLIFYPFFKYLLIYFSQKSADVNTALILDFYYFTSTVLFSIKKSRILSFIAC